MQSFFPFLQLGLAHHQVRGGGGALLPQRASTLALTPLPALPSSLVCAAPLRSGKSAW